MSGRDTDDRTVPLRASLDRQESRILDDRYRLDQLVGEGGMGQVYRARDLMLGEVVAVKLLHGRTSNAIELLRREVKLARRVTHPNVVRVHDIGVADDIVYLTMQLIDGRSLSAVLKDGPPPDAARLAREIAAGLDAAHRAGVVHSDLKPGNVLVAGEGAARRAFITDFGIGRALGEKQTDGRVLGTPSYMAPEQWRGEPVGTATDVYALGLLLYELFTGEHLPGAPEAPPPGECTARVRAARLPSGLGEAIADALEPDVGRRPGSVARFVRELAAITGEAGELEPPTGPRVAVLPFRAIGEEESGGYLGLGLAEELMRALAAHRGLAIQRGGAGPALPDDPVAAGRSLGATAVLSGTVRRSADRVRVTASLVEVTSGVELWGDRFDGRIDDLFSFEETMSLRICEALRVGWICPAAIGAAPPDAVDLYFRARRQMRFHVLAGPDGVAGLCQQALAIAPGFGPALALHALGCTKAWFVPTIARERDWAAAARDAVAAALAGAAGQAESHLAAAMVASQDGDYAGAVRALSRALELAPTTADAHLYLGRLQAEAGRARDAVRHLELALALDPALLDPWFDLARFHALRGDRSHCANLWQREGYARMWAVHLLLRIAAWYRDEPDIRRCLAELGELTAHSAEAAVLVRFARYLLGESDGESIDRDFVRLVPLPALSRRVRSNLHQLMAEGHAYRGDAPRALAHIRLAADEALVDLDWLSRCPLLEPLRGDPEFVAIHDLVRGRAEVIWRG